MYEDGKSKSFEYQYESPKNRAKWTTRFLWLMLIIFAIAIASGFAEISLIDRIINDRGNVTIEEIESNDARQGFIVIVQVIAYIITGIMFLRWIHLCARNIRAFGATGLEYSVRWSWLSWFIPFLNLIRPYQIVIEIWRASNPNIDVTQNADWRYEIRPQYFLVWWLIWNISNIIENFASRWEPESVDSILTYSRTVTFLNVASMAAAILAVRVVNEITARQIEKYRNMTHTHFNIEEDDI